MHHYDVAIIGGGVAGLWTANALKSRGYSVILLSNAPLGAGQTLASQGVIHGGSKYAIAGKLTDSSEQLAAMPGRWRDALNGAGDVDLSDAKILSEHQYLWSLPSVASQVVSFFGSKIMRGRADAIPRDQWPLALANEAYKGKVFRIDEPVLDPVSIVQSFSANLSGTAFQADCELVGRSGNIEKLVAGEIEISADKYILTAGAGNQALMDSVGIGSPKMQLRPLHQLIIRGRDLPDFYSVCMGNGPKPPIVTTTHTDSAGNKVWWIGGDVAEAKGVARSEDEQIAAGRELMAKLMPWTDWSQYDFFTARADRAEPQTDSGGRPPGAFCQAVGNALITWPTKLALAPNLADQVLAQLAEPQVEKCAPPALAQAKPGKALWDLF